MLRYVIVLTANLIVFLAIPMLFRENVEFMSTMMALVNPIYLFLQSQMLAINFKKPYINMGINTLCFVGYLFFLTGNIATNFLVFYIAMTFLGTRLGSNKRRINELKKKIEKERENINE